MAFAQPVQVSIEFWRKALECGLILDDLDLEKTAVDLFLDVFGSNEDDRVRDERDGPALLADELQFKFPVV